MNLAGGDTTAVDPVQGLCMDVLGRLPDQFNIRAVSVKYPIVYTNSMNTVLRQELIRYVTLVTTITIISSLITFSVNRFNRLLQFIRKSLIDVSRAINGQIAMIPSLETVYRAMSVGQLPALWASKSYPSLKPLGGYVSDLLQRLQFMQDWIDHGEPTVFWLSGLYFTQSFITGVLQNHSRKQRLQIDLVTIKFDVTHFEVEVGPQPEVGVFVKVSNFESGTVRTWFKLNV